MSYTVLDTDYTTYALTYECQELGAGFLSFKRQSGTILARDTTLPLATLDRVNIILIDIKLI